MEREAPSSKTSGHHGNSVCAVVVTYFPDSGLDERLRMILPQVETLVVVDNSPEGEQVRQLGVLAEHEGRICLVENHSNLGIAAALNCGLEHAMHLGCKWLLTLDQDTQCFPDMVDTLLNVYGACSERPAVVGSNYFDSRNARTAVPAHDGAECLEQKTVITSGSLIDVGAASELGGFREDYFIDQVDHEFCLRARAHGYRVVISRKPVMAHSVGTAGGAWLPFLGNLPNHPPVRKYYIARNTVVTVLGYWRQEPEWCLRRLVRLFFGLILMATLERHRLAKVQAFVQGIKDGFSRKMGTCPMNIQ